MKAQNGFIQIPMLIAIIAGVLALGGVGYVGVKQYKNQQIKESQKEKKGSAIAQNEQATTQESIEIEKLKKEIEEIKKQNIASSPSTQLKKEPVTEKPKISTTPPASAIVIAKTSKTFTTPNGAVLDDAGNIISPPTNIFAQSQANTNVSAGSQILSSEEVYTLVSPSVVLVSASWNNITSSGTGFIINDGRYTLTNSHVVEGVGINQTVQLKTLNGTTFAGVVLGKNSEQDLAIIFNLNSNQKLQAVTFGSSNSSSLKVGTDVYAFGFPLGLSTITFTKGAFSARQNVSWYSGTLLQTDAAINHGNSGGPLVNNKGEVIGVNTFRLSDTTAQGIYFAIPIQTAINLIPELSQYGQSRFELYPMGSSLTIARSMVITINYNDTLSCEDLGFKDKDLTTCDLYKNYYKDYQWIVNENL